MSFKTIFIIIISVVITVILMNNTEEIDFWIFGDARIPKLAILGSMFALGLIVGFLAGRPGNKTELLADKNIAAEEHFNKTLSDNLSDEDRDYIR